MNEELKNIYDQYKGINPDVTEEDFLNAYDIMGEEYLENIQDDLKKKDPSITENPSSPMMTSVPLSNDLEINPAQEQQLQGVQAENSTELDSTGTAGSLESVSTQDNRNIINANQDPNNPLGQIVVGKNELYFPNETQMAEYQKVQRKNMANIINVNNENIEIIDYNTNLKLQPQQSNLTDVSKNNTTENVDINVTDPFIQGKNNKQKNPYYGLQPIEITAENINTEGLDSFQIKEGDTLFLTKDNNLLKYDRGSFSIVPQKGQEKTYHEGYDFDLNNGMVEFPDEKNTEFDNNVLIATNKVPTNWVPKGGLVYAEDGLATDKTPISKEEQIKLYDSWEKEGWGRRRNRPDGGVEFYPNQDTLEEFNTKALGNNRITADDVEDVETQNRNKIYNLKLSAEEETKQVNEQISKYGKDVVDAYDGFLTREEQAIEDKKNFINNYTNNGYSQEQANQIWEQTKTEESESKNNISQNVIANIINPENYTTLGNILGNGYELTESEKNGWNSIVGQDSQSFADFWNSDYRKNMGIGDVGSSSLKAQTSTATGRRNIKDFYFDWKRRETVSYANTLSNIRDSKYKSKIKNAIDDDDAETVKQNRQIRGTTTVPAIQKELSQLDEIAKFEGQVNQNFDVTEKYLKEQREEYAGYQNGEFGDTASYLTKSTILGLAKVGYDLIGSGVSLASGISENASNYNSLINQLSSGKYDILQGEWRDEVTPYTDTKGNNYQVRNGSVFNEDKDGNLTYNESLTNNQKALENLTKGKEYKDFNVGAMTRTVVYQVAMMAAVNQVGLRVGRAVSMRLAGSAALAQIELGAGNMLSKSLYTLADVSSNYRVQSSLAWAFDTLGGFVETGKQAGLSKEQAFIYGSAQAIGVGLSSNLSPDSKYFQAYNAYDKQLIKLLSQNKWQEAKSLGLMFGKSVASNVGLENIQERFEQHLQDGINGVYNNVLGKNTKGESPFQLTTADGYMDVAEQTTAVTFAIEAFNFFTKGRIRTKGLSHFDKMIIASEIPDVGVQLNEMKKYATSQTLKSNIDQSLATIEEIKKYTKQIPEGVQLKSADTRDVLVSMQAIDKLEKQKKSNESRSMDATIDAEIQKLQSGIDEKISKASSRSKIDLNAKTGEELITTETEETPITNEQNPQPTPQPEADQAENSIAESQKKKIDNVEYDGKNNSFSGDFLNDYTFLAEGSESTVYRSNDGKSVIKFSEPYSSNEDGLYERRVESTLLGDLFGNSNLEVIGHYEHNGVKNPIYRQDYIEGETISEQEAKDYLKSKGAVEVDGEILYEKDNTIYRIDDFSDNYIRTKDGETHGIDVSIYEANEATVEKYNSKNNKETLSPVTTKLDNSENLPIKEGEEETYNEGRRIIDNIDFNNEDSISQGISNIANLVAGKDVSKTKSTAEDYIKSKQKLIGIDNHRSREYLEKYIDVIFKDFSSTEKETNNTNTEEPNVVVVQDQEEEISLEEEMAFLESLLQLQNGNTETTRTDTTNDGNAELGTERLPEIQQQGNANPEGVSETIDGNPSEGNDAVTTTIIEQRDTLLKTYQDQVQSFLDEKGITRQEYESLPINERKVYDDEFLNSDRNKNWEQSEESKQLQDLNYKISQAKIWSNGVAQSQIENGRITATEAKARIEEYGIPVPKDILEKAKAEQDKNTQNVESPQNQSIATSQGNTPAISQETQPKNTKTTASANGKYDIQETTDQSGNTTFQLFDKKGKEVNPKSYKTRAEYVAEVINGKTYPDTDVEIQDGMTEADYTAEVLEKSENPKEVAQILMTTPKFDKENVVGSKKWVIAQVIGKNVNRDSFINFGDANNITDSIARTYFSPQKGGRKIDQIAQEASERFSQDYSSDAITPQDIIDFMMEFPNDPSKAERPNNETYAKAEAKFIKLTGERPSKYLLGKLNPSIAQTVEATEAQKQTALAEYETLNNEERNTLVNEYDNWFNSLSLEQQISEYEYNRTDEENGDETATQPSNGQRESNTNAGNQTSTSGTVQRQKTSERYAQITKQAFEALIEKLKKPFAKAFKNLNVTTDWSYFSAKAKALGLNVNFDSQFSINSDERKRKQLELINKTNPAPNSYNTWVRSENDIKTAEEAFEEAFSDGEMYPDFTVDDMQEALDSGEVTIYSSYPIKEGVFVTPSRMNAESYSGNGKVYSKTVKTDSLAWIDQGEGQYAPVQMMRTANGEIYGAKLPDGTIYINPEKLNANTAIHEFSHLWEQVMPNAWKKGVAFLKETKTGKELFEKLKKDGNYSTLSDEQLWSEALNTHIGNYGEWRNNNPRGKMKELADWIKNVFSRIGNYFGIKANPETTLKQFTEGVVGDLLGGQEISTEVNAENSNQSTDFQIIGEQGARQIDQAEEATTRLDNLGVAREMETTNKSAKEIRMATGWERGADKKWRYEIPDIQIKKPFPTKGQTWKSIYNDNISQGKFITLGDMVEGDVLLAYPELNLVPVSIKKGKGGSYVIEYYGTDSIQIGEDVIMSDIQPIIIHEIQHAVQKIEGFAKGGTPGKFKDINLSTKTISNLEYEILDIVNSNSDFAKLYRRRNELQINKTKSPAEEQELDELYDVIAERFPEISDKLFDLNSRIQNLNDNPRVRTAFAQYLDLAGETEARNTETRANMSMAERQDTLLSETEDVAREDQIILMNAVGVQESNPGSANNLIPMKTVKEVTQEIQNNGWEAGVAKLQESNWYKNLSDAKKRDLTVQNLFSKNNLVAILVQNQNARIELAKERGKEKLAKEKESSKEAVKDVKQDAKDKIFGIKEKFNNKIAEIKAQINDKKFIDKAQKDLVDETISTAKSFLKENKIEGYVLSSEINSLINKLEDVRTKSDKSKALNDFFDQVEKVIEKTNYRAEKSGQKIEDIKTKAKEKLEAEKEKNNTEQKDLKKTFRDTISEMKKEYRDLRDKLDKMTNAQERLSEKVFWRKQAVNSLKMLLNDKALRNKITPIEISRLLASAEKIMKARNINNAFDDFMRKLDIIIDKADARGRDKEFEQHPDTLQADPNANHKPVTGRNRFKIWREKWLNNQGGILKPFLNAKDKAIGSSAWEIRIAKNTVAELTKEVGKLKIDKEAMWNDFDKAMRGDTEAFDKLPPTIQPFVQKMRNQMDNLSKLLVVNDLVTPQQAQNINENIGSYVTRGYAYFDGKFDTLQTAERVGKSFYRALFKKAGTISSQFDAKKWADAITVFQQNVLNDIANDKSGAYAHLTTDDAKQSYARTEGESKLLEYIKSLEEEYHQAKSSKNSADTSALEKRKDVPEPIRKLLGEYTDPRISFALTVARVSQLAYQRKFLTQVRDMGMGTVFFKEGDPNKPPTHNVKITSDSNDAFRPLNGLYTTSEFKDVFLDQSVNNTNNAIALWKKATAMVKVGKTVLSPITQAVNLFANPGFLLMNGNIANLKHIGKAMQTFADDMKGGSGTNPIVQELVEENIINSSIFFNEIDEGFGRNVEGDLIKGIRQNALVKKTGEFIGYFSPFRMYKASDDMFKAFAYYSETDRYAKAMYGKKYKDLVGDERAEVKQIASEVVKNTMPNYDRQYKITRKTGVFLGNFMAFQAESIRTAINSSQIAIADMKNPKTRSVGIQRLAGVMAYNTVYATVTTYLAKMAGLGFAGLLGMFDDDDEKEKNKELNRVVPEWMRSTEKTIAVERDGSLTVHTYGNANPYGIWFRVANAYKNGSAHNRDGGLISMVDEFFTPFLGTEMTLDWALNTFVSHKNDWGAPLITTNDHLEYTANKLAPSFVKVFKDNSDNNDNNDFNIYNVIGIKKYNFNPTEQLNYRFNDVQKKLVDLGAKRYGTEIKFNTGKISEEEYIKQTNDYQDEMDDIVNKFKPEFEAFQAFGADDSKVREELGKEWKMKKNPVTEYRDFLLNPTPEQK